MTTTLNGTEIETPRPVRGFPGIRCPRCGAEDTVSLHLRYVDVFFCADCSGEWGVREVREIVERWSGLLAWLEQAPVVLK